MNLLRFLTAACLLLLVHTAAPAQGGADADRPNLIAIVTDDQARWAMGAYGNEDIHTPHMDRIAAEGALLLNAFANTPVCSPSRATYFSGLHPTEVGITDWISPPEEEAEVGLAAPIWPAVLDEHGYATALIGKWHLGVQPRYHPTNKGFDHFMGFLDGGNRPMDPVLMVNGERKKLDGPLPDILTTDAIEFIKKNQDGPFAVSLHYRAPHTPYGPVPEQDRAHYENVDPEVPQLRGLDIEKLKRTTLAYYASISSVDRNIGRLLDALDEMGLAENTIVIFTSDHGYNEGRHHIKTKGNGPWIAGGIRGPKRPNMFDTSIRIPMAVRWPGVVEPGTKIDATFSTLDMHRTVLGMLGLPVPEGADPRGVDLSPLLRGRELPEDVRDRPLFGQYDLHNSGLAYMRMIRGDRYKYVRHFHANNQDELSDLKSDPNEKRNLLRWGEPRRERHAEPLRRLRDQLQQLMEAVDDPLLRDGY